MLPPRLGVSCASAGAGAIAPVNALALAADTPSHAAVRRKSRRAISPRRNWLASSGTAGCNLRPLLVLNLNVMFRLPVAAVGHAVRPFATWLPRLRREPRGNKIAIGQTGRSAPLYRHVVPPWPD